MELELGLKITHNRDDLTSSMADLRITRDPSGPLFISRETDSKFFLVGHLKGFRRENIDVEINEAGNRIAISGKRPVQEVVLIGWIMRKKEVEIRAFRKIFLIPDGVVLDKIKAKLNDEKSTLTIIMPKSEKGICGVGIEEVHEEEEDSGRPETMEPVADEVPGIEKAKEEIQQEKPKEIEEVEQVVRREVGTSEPEMNKVIADEVPENDSNLEAPNAETVEQKKEGLTESGQVLEQASDQGHFEATKAVADEFPEKDYSGEAVKEKPEEVKEEIGSEVQKVDGGDQVVEKSQGRAEIEPQASIEEVEPEPQITTEMNQETTSVAPHEAAEKESDRSQITEPQPTQETLKEKLPEERTQVQELEEHVQSPENSDSTTPGADQVTKPLERRSSPSAEIEEKETTKENHQVENEKPEESPKQEPEAEVQESTKPESHQEPEAEVQESTKPESHQEPEQQETSNLNNLVDQASKDKVPGKEETQEKGIKDKETSEELSEEKVDGHESQELEKQKCVREEAAHMKQPVTKKSKVCSPLVVAGSALLVSILVFVIHFIRAKKR